MPEVSAPLLMFLAYRYTEERVLSELAAAGYDDITLAQARVFQRVAEDGIRLTDLARQAQLTTQSTQFLVDQLEAAGYVERRSDPADARARLIVIAPRGRAAQTAARVVEAAVAAEWTEHLGAERMAQLRQLLLDLRTVVDPYA